MELIKELIDINRSLKVLGRNKMGRKKYKRLDIHGNIRTDKMEILHTIKLFC